MRLFHITHVHFCTISVERKRKRRMIRAGKINESVETYESLVRESCTRVHLVLLKFKVFLFFFFFWDHSFSLLYM